MKIGFIGAGNMGSAIAKAVALGNKKIELMISDPDAEKAGKVRDSIYNETNVEAKIVSNEIAAKEADFLFLAVKPQVMEKVLAGMKEALCARKDEKNFTIVTMAAGLECKTIRKFAGGNFPVIRIMPNTPVAIGNGVIGYCGTDVSEKKFAQFEKLMNKAGLVLRVEEDKIDAVCALSGCGPAFVYMFINGLAEAGAKLGLPEEKALMMAANTVLGAAGMVNAGKGTPEALRIAVCSPGGATIEGVKVLQEEQFEEIAGKAVQAAYEKTLKLK